MSWQPSGSVQTQNNVQSEQKSFDGRSEKTEDYPLYITNIPLTVTENDLEEMFAQAGEVIRAKQLPPKDGRNSCVGFITYKSQEAAEKAISMFDNVQIDNFTLRVDYTKAFRERDGARSFNEQNNNAPLSQNGFNQTFDQNVYAGSFNSIGRGIHYDNKASDQPLSIGRGIVPSSEGSMMNSDSFLNGVGASGDNNSQAISQNPQIAAAKSQSAQYTNDGSQPAMNGFVNGFSNMHVTEPIASQGFGNQEPSGHGNQENDASGNQGVGFDNQYTGGFSNQGGIADQENNISGSEHSLGNQCGFANQNGLDNQGSVCGNQGLVSSNQGGFVNQGPGFGNQGEFASQGVFANKGSGFGDQSSGFGNQGSGIGNQGSGIGNQGSLFGNQGPGFGYQGSGLGNQGGFSNQGSGFSNQGSGFSNQGLGFSNQGSGFSNQGSGFGNQGGFGGQRFGESSNNSGFGSNSNAEQTFGNNMFQVSSRLPRSQYDMGNKNCNKCGEMGHFARQCPSNSATGQNCCHKCGEEGHFARDCPNGSGGRSGGGTCHQCGQTGHFARECPERSNNSSQGGCHRCGEQGHFARECPSGSGGGSSQGGCHRCGEQGHFVRECPNQDSSGSCPRPADRVDYVPPPMPEDIDLLFEASVHKGINFDRFDNIPVNVSGNNPPQAIQRFEDITIPDQMKSNVQRAEFTKPTPIQKHGIPIILHGRDIMGCAQTGSGKTLAFLLPVMIGMTNSRLPETSYMSGDAPSPAALCIAPTRELAVQIYTEAIKFSCGTYLRPVVCYGGVSVQHQLDHLQRGCHILIGTPGRIIDFAGRSKVNLGNVRYLILDEADRMLDMGFEGDIRKIINQFGVPQKTQRQTLMFSATFPNDIQKLAAEFLNDYIFVAVGSVGGTNLDIKQEILAVDGDKKRSVLMEILGQSGTDKTLVFVERKRNADFLASWLSQNNFPATSISGDRTQKEREDALRDFRNGRAPILIATSVAARGLDIPDVKHVVNYDLPQQIEEYVHRIGRTGRIGNQGKATAFFDKGKDDKLARSLVKVLSDALQDVPDWLEGVAERALGTSYGPAGGRFRSRDARQFGQNRGGGDRHSNGGSGNVQSAPASTNISFTNQTLSQTSNNRQDDGDEEEWE